MAKFKTEDEVRDTDKIALYQAMILINNLVLLFC